VGPGANPDKVGMMSTLALQTNGWRQAANPTAGFQCCGVRRPDCSCSTAGINNLARRKNEDHGVYGAAFLVSGAEANYRSTSLLGSSGNRVGDSASVRGANRIRDMVLRGEPDFETADPPTGQARYNGNPGEGLNEKPGMRDSGTHAANAREITALSVIPSTPWQVFFVIMRFRKLNRG
jgi:hypothetical protein